MEGIPSFRNAVTSKAKATSNSLVGPGDPGDTMGMVSVFSNCFGEVLNQH